MRFNNMGQ
jgi:hypothetical protein